MHKRRCLLIRGRLDPLILEKISFQPHQFYSTFTLHSTSSPPQPSSPLSHLSYKPPPTNAFNLKDLGFTSLATSKAVLGKRWKISDPIQRNSSSLQAMHDRSLPTEPTESEEQEMARMRLQNKLQARVYLKQRQQQTHKKCQLVRNIISSNDHRIKTSINQISKHYR